MRLLQSFLFDYDDFFATPVPCSVCKIKKIAKYIDVQSKTVSSQLGTRDFIHTYNHNAEKSYNDRKVY